MRFSKTLAQTMLPPLSLCQPRMQHISSHLSAIHQEVEAGLDEVRTYCHYIASNLTNYSSQLGLDCSGYTSSKSEWGWSHTFTLLQNQRKTPDKETGHSF